MPTLLRLLTDHQHGRALAGDFYTDQTVFDSEMDWIYQRQWLFAGHVSEIPNVGDYITFQVGSESVVITRADHETINAFFNICRHRGSPLCTDHSGHQRQFVCPYHAWVYDLSGNLLAVTRMGDGFDLSKHNLLKCKVEVTNGLIFVCLADTPPSFNAISETISRFIEPHGLESARVCYASSRQLAANWKVVAENSWECYHCATAHPLYSHVMPYSRATAAPKEREEQAADRQAWEKEVRGLGLVTGGVEPTGDGIVFCQRYPVRAGLFTQSVDGSPVAPLMGAYRQFDRGVTAVQIFPACGFSICNDYAYLERMTPISSGVTEIKYYWLVDGKAKEGVDYKTERVVEFWTRTAVEDQILCERTQKGIRSRKYIPGPLGEMEIDVHRLTEWYIAQLRRAFQESAQPSTMSQLA